MTTIKPFSTMTAQQQALFLSNIDWEKLIPAAIDLFKHIQNNQLIEDWQRTLDIIKEILSSLALAEEQSAMRIDWATILPIILKFLIPFLIGLGEDEPIEV